MLEASLLAEYGVDLVEDWPTLTVRRLWVLVDGLPESAALWREHRWTQQDELAAATIEFVDHWGRMICLALGRPVRGKPLRIKRPEVPQEKSEATNDQRALAAFVARHGGR